jgi:hypothetical protein
MLRFGQPNRKTTGGGIFLPLFGMSLLCKVKKDKRRCVKKANGNKNHRSKQGVSAVPKQKLFTHNMFTSR